MVLPALRRAPAGRRRDRAVRPLLVQPRRRRAGHGLLHARASTTASCTSARSSSGCSSRTGSCCASTGSRSATRSRSAASGTRSTTRCATGSSRRWTSSRSPTGRTTRAPRTRCSCTPTSPRPVVRRRGRRQAARPAQHDRSPAEHLRLPRRAPPAGHAPQASEATGYVRPPPTSSTSFRTTPHRCSNEQRRALAGPHRRRPARAPGGRSRRPPVARHRRGGADVRGGRRPLRGARQGAGRPRAPARAPTSACSCRTARRSSSAGSPPPDRSGHGAVQHVLDERRAARSVAQQRRRDAARRALVPWTRPRRRSSQRDTRVPGGGRTGRSDSPGARRCDAFVFDPDGPRRAAGAQVDDDLLAALEESVPRPIVSSSCTPPGQRARPKGVDPPPRLADPPPRGPERLRRYTPDDVLFSNSPFFWIGGFAYSLLGTLLAGATLGARTPPMRRRRSTCSSGPGRRWSTASPHPSRASPSDPSFARRDLFVHPAREPLADHASDARPADPELRHNMLGMTEAGSVCLASDDEGDQPEHRRGRSASRCRG